MVTPAPTACLEGEVDDFVSLEPRRRMGNAKGSHMGERATREAVNRARRVQARTPARTAR